jgi:hypothetical protein
MAGGEYRLGSDNPVVLIELTITSWCNYTCAYCVTTVQQRREQSSHAFDRHPVEAWIAAFERVPFEYSLLCRGGEPFLDHANFSTFLAAVGASRALAYARIDTNGSWNPERYDSVPREVRPKFQLNVSFHPTQIDLEPFARRIDRIVEAGWKIGMINYVMEAKQAGDYARVRDYFRERHDIYVNPNPDAFDAELRGPIQIRRNAAAKLRTLLATPDLVRKTGDLTWGKPCFFPSIGYFVNPAGIAVRACGVRDTSDPKAIDFMRDSHLLRPLTSAVRCPQPTCQCLDRYAFLDENPTRGRSLDLLDEYVTDSRAVQDAARSAANRPS